MATTLTTDVASFMLAGLSKYFTENWDTWANEYAQWTTVRGDPKLTGIYQQVGNLSAAEVMGENDPVGIETISQNYQTTITVDQIGRGLAVSLRAAKGDLYNLLGEGKMRELLRALKVKMEQISIKPWDDAFSVNQVDGVPMCSAVKPCADSGATYLTLATGALDAAAGAASIKTALQYMASQKNAQGDPFVAIADTFGTHAMNQVNTEALFGSALIPFQASTSGTQIQTKNTLPRLRPVYSHYTANSDNWFLWDSKIDHVVSQHLDNMASPMIETHKDPDTKATIADAVFFWGAASLPNPGIVGSSGA